MPHALLLALGALAVSSGIAMLTFDIIFAVALYQNSSPVKVEAVAIVAAGLSAVTAGLSFCLLRRQYRYHCEAQIQNRGDGRRYTYVLAAIGGLFGIMSAVTSALFLVLMESSGDLPKKIISSSRPALITGAFIVWAISLLAEAFLIICIIIIQRRDLHEQNQTYDADDKPQNLADMMEAGRPRAPSGQNDMEKQTPSFVDSPPPSKGHSQAASDTMSSFRSSFTQHVRPMTSKTKLISHNTGSPRSIASTLPETISSTEDGFDSWDTSTVDAQSRKAVSSVSPTTPRCLETIPASPATSRSVSPCFPLDLAPPKSGERGRSYSPANSLRNLSRTCRNQSPTGSMYNEAHIHPLFRTDSPTPPPSATPGTVVTAAPGAGLVISDRQSIRSIHRMRSGSLPSSSPLVHSDSLDSLRMTEREELERLEEARGERTLTPPIPDFILNGGPRNSMQVYSSRRKPAGLGILGEVRDA
ncbi:hypothetical protein BUE80_DR000401 [Diplocarpon rosae]|nr:hypothetical protein BUE80_DR000401 [Diplocarpon rosae]